MIYWPVDVCWTCYITYSLMHEYFNEVEKLTSEKGLDWIHSEKLIASENAPPLVTKE